MEGKEQHREFTLREATCPLHKRKTTSFVGVNEGGWVFGCYGPRELKQTDELAHFFVAAPPPGSCGRPEQVT